MKFSDFKQFFIVFEDRFKDIYRGNGKNLHRLFEGCGNKPEYGINKENRYTDYESIEYCP
jgi:hypothetical protein